MGILSTLTAQPVLFTHQDKTYQVSPWTFEIQSAFERYLESNVLEGYHRTSHLLPPIVAEKTLAAIYRDIGTGVYTFGTEAVGKALSSPTHLRYMFFLCLKRNHPEVQFEDIRKWAQDPATWERMVECLNTANFDPNDKTPATPTTTKNDSV